MDIFELSDMTARRQQSGQRYLEFLYVPTMSAGLFELAAGAVDTQRPHTEDEVYYVIKGRGAFRAGEATRDVKEGSIIFVEAGVDHRFHSITEDLSILVVFAPPRGSRA